MRKRLFLIVLILLTVTYSHGTVPVECGKKALNGKYIGKHIEYISEKILFQSLYANWKAQKVLKNKIFSGELHSDSDIVLVVQNLPQGYRARLKLRNSPVEGQIEWSLPDILKKEVQSKFRPSKSDILRLNFMPHSYWLKFSVNNTEKNKKDLILEIDKHFFGFIHLYTLGKDDISVNRGDFTNKMQQREIKHKNIAFAITAHPGTNSFYLRVDSWFIDIVPLRLWSRDSFYYHVAVDNAVLGLLCGIFLLLFLYNFTLLSHRF